MVETEFLCLNQLVTNCHQLKLKSPKDGKRYATDVATTEELLRIIQSVPSKKASELKFDHNWLKQTLLFNESVNSCKKTIERKCKFVQSILNKKCKFGKDFIKKR